MKSRVWQRHLKDSLTRLRAAERSRIALERDLPVAPNPYMTETIRDPATGETVFNAWLERALPVEVLAEHFAAVVHGLRSSLNYLACAMVLASGGKIDKKVEFPIFDDAKKFERDLRKKLPCVPDDRLDVVRALQPFNIPEPVRHPLQLLHTLDIEEKHHSLNIVAAGVVPSEVQIGGEAVAIEHLVIGDYRRAKLLPENGDRVELLRMKVHALGQSTLTTSFGAVFRVSLASECLPEPMPIDLLARDLIKEVARCRQLFLPFAHST